MQRRKGRRSSWRGERRERRERGKRRSSETRDGDATIERIVKKRDEGRMGRGEEDGKRIGRRGCIAEEGRGWGLDEERM